MLYFLRSKKYPSCVPLPPHPPHPPSPNTYSSPAVTSSLQSVQLVGLQRAFYLIVWPAAWSGAQICVSDAVGHFSRGSNAQEQPLAAVEALRTLGQAATGWGSRVTITSGVAAMGRGRSGLTR